MDNDEPDAPRSASNRPRLPNWLIRLGSTRPVGLLLTGKSTLAVGREHTVYWFFVAVIMAASFLGSHYLSHYLGFLRFGIDQTLHRPVAISAGASLHGSGGDR